MRTLNVLLTSLVVLLTLVSPAVASPATDAKFGESVGKFVNFINGNWVLVLLLVVALLVVFMWNRQANAPSGTWSASPFIILLVVVLIGIFLCSGFKGEAVTPEKVDPQGQPGDPVGKPSDYIDLKGNTLERNDKSLATNWEVAVSQEDGKAGLLVTKTSPRIIDPAKPIFLYFSPDQKALPGRGALGTMKYK